MAEVKFGFVLEINGQEIPLDPKSAIGDLQTHEVEVGLPAGTEVRLGRIAGGLQGFINGVAAAFGAPTVTWPTELPGPLSGAVDYLKSLDVTINDLWIRFPPGLGTPKDYRFGVYVSGAPLTLVGDALKFRGFAVQIAAGAGIRQ